MAAYCAGVCSGHATSPVAYDNDSHEGISVTVVACCDRSPSKMKKHSKPSFKFSKKEKFYKPREKVSDLTLTILTIDLPH